MVNNHYILYVYSGGVKEVLLNENARDNCTEPHINLRNSFERMGYKYEWTVKRPLEDYDWIFFAEASSAGYVKPFRLLLRKVKDFVYNRQPSIFEEAKRKNLRSTLVLITTEPLHYGNFNLKFLQHFGHVFTWWTNHPEDNRFHKLYLPITEIFPAIDEIPYQQKKMLVNISYNKTSRHKCELYSERLKTIRFFEEHFPMDFDHYGVGWNEKNKRSFKDFLLGVKSDHNYLSSYRGKVEHKWEVLPKYKFALCYENVQGYEGYVSEKIFDAIRCKSVPVYWGAPDVSKYVDDAAFIRREYFKSNEDLAKYLTSIGEIEYGRLIAAGQRYLKSDKFKLFLSSNYVSTIFSSLRITQ